MSLFCSANSHTRAVCQGFNGNQSPPRFGQLSTLLHFRLFLVLVREQGKLCERQPCPSGRFARLGPEEKTRPLGYQRNMVRIVRTNLTQLDTESAVQFSLW